MAKKGSLSKWGHMTAKSPGKPGSKRGARGSKKATGTRAPMNEPTANRKTYTGPSTAPGHVGGGQPPLTGRGSSSGGRARTRGGRRG